MNRQSAFAVACAVSATAVLGVGASPAEAFTLQPGATIFTTPISLDKLIGTNNAFQVDDKIFHDFVFQTACAGPGNLTCDDIVNLPPADRPVSPLFPSQVTVGPSENQINLASGIGLFLNDDWRADPGWVYDLAFGFDVHVVEDSDQYIKDAHLKIVGNDTGTISIIEDISDPISGAVLAKLSASENKTVDWAEFEPVKKIRVLKDIQLRGTNGERAEFSILIQEFSQTEKTPEPGTMAGLLAIGSLSIGAMLKRHFAKKA
ncbi:MULTISPECIES: PEP-CTERM sorting domain-containing protein [unclassified Coleofasciculus]|uniref:PEP-CTERM sorting domain-containing protein n=1 Tax=unclassified Coleofasciculus TaxID=2692782 RepID=UPI001880B973|nr:MULTISPECIES: PEP-CTERM sorting domain-containing protein [unclassified Coleofasciculus]MBE9129058.1 PEP-CTERM sorting domain-containing protein [Coleofasciculus sp. LEGE 07081]MBE9151740.1 PEP-CTERM sorting domain-containing protein [Coleofasciculus sp. LEGE 07092]